MSGQTNVVVKNNGLVSGSHCDYLINKKLINSEKPSRTLFNFNDDNLTRIKAENYLSNNQKMRDGEIFEIFVSPEAGTFEKLGKTKEEREANFRKSIRDGIKEIFRELEINEYKFVASIHQNTNHQHAHILFSKYVTDKEGLSKTINKLPVEFLYRQNGLNSKFGEILSRSFEKNFIAASPKIQPTLYNNTELNFPKKINEDKALKTLEYYSQARKFDLEKINLLKEKQILYVNGSGGLTFVRRDENGIATGYTNESGWTGKADEKGFFYIGNLNTGQK